MDKLKNKKVVIGLLSVTILSAIVVLASSAFLLGRGMNTPDSQAAKVLPTPMNLPPGVKIVPNSGAIAQNADIKVNVVVDFGTMVTSSAMQVRLNFKNMQITGGTVNNNGGNYLVIGTCNQSGAIYTSNAVCFDMAAKSGAIRSGDVLATFTVRATTSNAKNLPTMTVATAKNHGYMRNGKLTLIQPTTLATYSHKSTVPTTTKPPVGTSSTPQPTKPVIPSPTKSGIGLSPTAKPVIPSPTKP